MMRPSLPLRALLVAALLLAAATAVSPSGGAVTLLPAAKADVIVGFKNGLVDAASIALSGGTLLRTVPGLGIAGVKAPDRPGFMMAMAKNPNVAFVETNDVVRAVGTAWDATGWDATGWDNTGWDATGWDSSSPDGTGWDGTGWDGTGWDGTGWDGTGWDGTGWDGTGWDGTGWDGTGWDGTGWDGTGWDGINFAGTGWDGTGWDGTGWDAMNWSGIGYAGTGWDGTGWDGTGWGGSLWNASFLASKATSSGTGDPLTKYQWGWHTVNAKQAIKAARGEGGTVCVIDSGVDYAHPDLAASMWRDPLTGAYGVDLFNGDNDPMDDAGHGTHVAGIAAAANRNGQGMAGAGAGKIMAVKVLGADGAGTELDLANGIAWCVAKGARVVSMSLSTDQNSPAVHAAVKDAVARGAVLVAAAGNTGKTGSARFPAAYPEVIAVAATMPDGRWAPYSTRAGYVDVAAPGWGIVSTYRGGGYAAINGTSMATPFVSGAVSLLLKANASLTSTDVKAVLARSSVDLGPPGPDVYLGFGFLRADRAVKMAYSR